MKNDDAKRLGADPDGLLTYEYIANNIDTCYDDLPWLIENMIKVDRNGQFTASAARYLHAIDPQKYDTQISTLVSATIGKDREHRYLSGLLSGIYGEDYAKNAEELSRNDDNFRRIYKRLFPESTGSGF